MILLNDTSTEKPVNQWVRGGIYFLLFVALFLLYTYHLSSVGPYDFDSTKNFLISQEIYKGDFKNLYSHAAPVLHLLNALIYSASPSYLAQEYVSTCLVIFSILILAFNVQSIFKLTWVEEILLILVTGTCTFIANTASYISIEPLSLLLFVILFIQLYRYPLYKPVVGVAICSLLVGIMLTVNYKTLLLLPVIGLVAALWHREIFKPMSILVMLSLMLVPYMIIALVGVMFFSHEFIDSFKTLYAVAVVKDVNPVIEVSSFNTDILFYFKYLWHFENPILLGIVLVSPILYRKTLFARSHNPVFIQLVFIFVLYFLLVMSPLQKAPRGLLFIYPLMSLILFLTIIRFYYVQSMKYVLLILFIGYQTYLIYHHIIQYRSSNYAQMAALIDQKEIKEISSSASINIMPYLKDTKVNLKFSEKDLQNTEYLLLDHYYLAAELHSFDSIAQYMPTIHFRERTLEAPLLFLENCEYSGLSFEEAMKNRQKVMTDTFHLSLIKMRE